VVWVEVGEEDAVDGEAVESGVEHAAHRPRAEVEDERLSTRLYRDAALSPVQAGTTVPKPTTVISIGSSLRSVIRFR
jgi:hypothetical protein